jgi:hypothetical protein
VSGWLSSFGRQRINDTRRSYITRMAWQSRAKCAATLKISDMTLTGLGTHPLSFSPKAPCLASI